MKRIERFMASGANWRLENVKRSMVHENKPDAACIDEIEKAEIKRNVQAT